MTHTGIHRTCSESEYRAACLELDEMIQRYDGSARFTLDFSDESFASAA
jgi:hypothetical protein